MRKPLYGCSLFALVFLTLLSCGGGGSDSSGKSGLRVVATLFPLYDFCTNIGGEKAQVTLLLPPGIEPHSFDPKPRDILRINEADLFVFTGPFMEPWAMELVGNREDGKVVTVDSSKGVQLRTEIQPEEPEKEGHGGACQDGGQAPTDPHIWLDLSNAQKMVDNILAGFVQKDPQNSQFYESNAAAYKAKLRTLDEQFKAGLTTCESRLFVHGGHYAFNYLARRYGLTYVSAYGFSPNAEPSPRRLAEIVKTMRQHNTKYVFYEELIQPRVADVIAKEAEAKLLPLNGGHNVTREEMERGVTFISLLEQDLGNLRTGLRCR